MRLKKLIVQGFKSFADRTELSSTPRSQYCRPKWLR